MDGFFQVLETTSEFHNRSHSRKSPEKVHKSYFDIPIQPAGNLATQRLLRSGAIRAKLAISQPGDPSEQEADRVADHIMRMPEPSLQRTCAACESGATPCPKCEADKTAQRKPEVGADPIVTSAPGGFVQSLGSGHPLDPSTRAFFDPRLGYDFSRVRLH